jgi:hypothetical protein
MVALFQARLASFGPISFILLFLMLENIDGAALAYGLIKALST